MVSSISNDFNCILELNESEKDEFLIQLYSKINLKDKKILIESWIISNCKYLNRYTKNELKIKTQELTILNDSRFDKESFFLLN